MKLLNSIVMGSGGSQIGKLQLPVQFQRNMKCSRIRLRANFTLNSTGAYTLTAADVLALFTFVFGNFTLKFGVQNYELVDDAIPFSVFRLLYVSASLRDFLLLVNAGAVMQQLNQYTTGGPQAIIFAGAGNKAITFEACRSFTWERLSEHMHDWCPGFTQMRNLQLEILTGTTPPTINAGGVTISGNITVLVIADTVPTDRDVFARVFRAFRNSISGLTSPGPGWGGGLLSLLELSNPGLSSAFTDVAVRRGDGDEAIHDIVPYQDILHEQQSILPLGAFDPNTLATVIYAADDQLDGPEIPSFQYAELFQPNNDIATPQTLWIHLPTMDQNYADTVMASCATGPYGAGSTVVATNDAVAAGATVPPHIAAFGAQALLTPADRQYGTLPGRQYSVGAQPGNYIPPTLAKAASAASSGSPNAAASVASRVASAIPGHTSPARGVASPNTLRVASQVAALGGGNATKSVGSVQAFHGKTK